MPSTMCVSFPSFELHKPEYPSCDAMDEIMRVSMFTNYGVLWSKTKLWGCCYVKFIAVPSFICNFFNDLVSYINIHCSLMWYIHCFHNRAGQAMHS